MRNLIIAYVVALSVIFTIEISPDSPLPPIPKVAPLPLFNRTTFTSKDIDCLAKNVYYESKGEVELGQLAVAQVTVNRWKQNPKRTICQVVYQAGQFSWTDDETIKLPLQKSATWKQALKIARRILNKKECCLEVGNATFYHANYVKPDWAKTKKVVAKIGHHIFYR